MSAYTIYDPETGEILFQYDGPDSMLLQNTPPGASAVSGRFQDGEYRIENGRAVKKSKAIDIDQMREAAMARAEMEYKERAAALFDPVLYVAAEKARRDGGEMPEGVAEMEAAILTLAEERKALRAAIAKEKTQKGLRALSPGLAADPRFN